MVVEAVIFDLDGTLAQFNLDFKAMRSEIRSYLISLHIPISILDINESIFETLKKVEIYVKNKVKSAEAFEELRIKVLAVAEKYEMQAAASTSLLSGTVETLRELQQMKLKLGLCTTSSEAAANYILQRFKIDHYFKVVIPRDKVKYMKPNTEQFQLALKTLVVYAKDSLIVGDSIVDMQSAKELKAIAIGLPTGLSSINQLIGNGANYIITSLTDLPTLVKEIDKP